jgi:predicted  nucleic acid-binding Zn-ribbon protein
MVDSTFLLTRLQVIEDKIQHDEISISEMKKVMDNDIAVTEITNKLQSFTKSLDIVKNESSSLGSKINDLRNKKNQFHASLYSGKIQNSKELQDLQTEISTLTEAINQNEELQIRKWEEIEKGQLLQQEYEMEIARLKVEHNAGNSILLAKIDQLNHDIEGVKTEKKGIRDQLSSSFLSIFENLLLTKKGVAVAQIEENCCSICGTTLTPAECQRAKIHTILTYCPNCGRILYAG